MKASADATVIDGGGRILMPGLIDTHAHLALVENPMAMANNRTWDWRGAVMGMEAQRYVMRGFTTVRDVGGPVFGLKAAIDSGLAEGPRIYPSGGPISQTSGHGDFRNFTTGSSYFDRAPQPLTEMGYVYLADGVPEVQKAVRENFRMQASQIKVMAGGGVISLYDPLEALQYTFEELKAAVDETNRWGTYMIVHALTDDAISLAIDAGVKCIDHGAVISEKTIKRMAKKGIWLVPTAAIYLQDIATNSALTQEVQREKAARLQKGQIQTLKWAKKYGVKIGWGTDAFVSRKDYDNNLQEFTYRAPYFTNAEMLQQITGNNGELLAMSGFINPYKAGALGVIKPGAYADLLILEDNPLDDIKVMMDYENNLKLIMKDGKVYKNTL